MSGQTCAKLHRGMQNSEVFSPNKFPSGWFEHDVHLLSRTSDCSWFLACTFCPLCPHSADFSPPPLNTAGFCGLKKTEKSRLNDPLHLNGTLTESSLSQSHDLFESVSIVESVIVKVQSMNLVLGLCPPEGLIHKDWYQADNQTCWCIFSYSKTWTWVRWTCQTLCVTFTQTETQTLYRVFLTLTTPFL